MKKWMWPKNIIKFKIVRNLSVFYIFFKNIINNTEKIREDFQKWRELKGPLDFVRGFNDASLYYG